MQDSLGGVPILLSKVVIFVLDESNLIDYGLIIIENLYT